MKDDTLELIGHFLKAGTKRDAIHIAVAPVITAVELSPGDHVGLSSDGFAVNKHAEPIGVVDPFLPMKSIKPGSRVFVFLYPGSITSLRHEWRHSAFDGPRENSEQWLHDFAKRHKADYEELIAQVKAGHGYCFGSDSGAGVFRGENDLELEDFWAHLQAITGETFTSEARDQYFRCGC